MKAIDLMKSISDKIKPLNTFENNKLISVEKSGWMSKKQCDYLVSLMVKEGYDENFGFEFHFEGYTIKRAAPNGARSWRLYKIFY